MFLFDTNLIKTNGIGKENFLIFAFFEILRKAGLHSLERLRRHGAVAEQARRAERERAAERRALFFSLGDVKKHWLLEKKSVLKKVKLKLE